MATTPNQSDAEKAAAEKAAAEKAAAEKAAAEKAAAEKAAAEKAAAEKAAAAAPAEAEKPTLTIGKVYRLRAVHGDLYHPFLKPEVKFEQENSQKIECDSWIKIQFDAGKLAIDD